MFFNEVKKFQDESGVVQKFVFTNEKMVAEAVLYVTDSRRVVCCSTQSGCPVGCTFCGTGKFFFGNLPMEAIVEQVETINQSCALEGAEITKTQIMFMSMGEPMLNYENVIGACEELNQKFETAELLISTICPNKITDLHHGFIEKCKELPIGLQFSVHRSTDEARSEIIPYKEKLSLLDMSFLGQKWSEKTGKFVYVNYFIEDGINNSKEDYERLTALFPKECFKFTFSVVCKLDRACKSCGSDTLEKIGEFEQLFINEGYNTRVFNPAGQDDIGGGCGQLWFVQEWAMNKKGGLKKEDVPEIEGS